MNPVPPFSLRGISPQPSLVRRGSASAGQKCQFLRPLTVAALTALSAHRGRPSLPAHSNTRPTRPQHRPVQPIPTALSAQRGTGSLPAHADFNARPRRPQHRPSQPNQSEGWLKPIASANPVDPLASPCQPPSPCPNQGLSWLQSPCPSRSQTVSLTIRSSGQAKASLSPAAHLRR